MVLLEDTRNQIGKHKAINAYLKSVGLRVIRSKLLVGDYVVANDQHISVDTKKDMIEVSQDIYQDHKRFRSELKLAQECGIHLVILIEDNSVGSYEDLLKWTNPQPNRSALTPNGERCYKVMKAMEYTYGAEFQFCNKADTGRRIVEILTGGRNG